MWANQGRQWLLKKNYHQAIRCFRNNGDTKAVSRIEAMIIAN